MGERWGRGESTRPSFQPYPSVHSVSLVMCFFCVFYSRERSYCECCILRERGEGSIYGSLEEKERGIELPCVFFCVV